MVFDSLVDIDGQMNVSRDLIQIIYSTTFHFFLLAEFFFDILFIRNAWGNTHCLQYKNVLSQHSQSYPIYTATILYLSFYYLLMQLITCHWLYSNLFFTTPLYLPNNLQPLFIYFLLLYKLIYPCLKCIKLWTVCVLIHSLFVECQRADVFCQITNK